MTPRLLPILLLTICTPFIQLTAQMRPLPKASDVPKLREDAAKGDPVALYQLAVCHFEEIGVPIDFQEALKLATQSAEKGDVPAMVMVSDLHSGFGKIERNKHLSLNWAKKAQAKGDPLGAVAMALCHARGFTGSRSFGEAIRVLKPAAASDNTHVLCHLASFLIFDTSLDSDPQEGLRLAHIADSRGEQEAAGLIALAYLNGRGVGRDIELARLYAERDVSRRGRMGRVVLGLLCFQPENLPVDGAKALKELRVCSKYGVALATGLIGRLYLEGNGVPTSLTEAERLLREGAKMGDVFSMDLLGGMLFNGNGVVMDKPLAMGLWQAAAAMGSSPVQQAINNWGPELRNSQDFAKGTVIASSLKRQFDSGDFPAELEAGFHSTQQVAPALSRRPEQRAETTSGTALIFDNNGHCFTNHHVIKDAKAIRVYSPRTKSLLTAKLVASDEANDLAILLIEKWPTPAQPMHTPPPLVSAAKAKLGDKVFTIGFPLSGFLESQEHKFTSGDISAPAGIGDDRRLFQITTPIQPGNSGGALALTDGRVVAVVVSSVNSAAVFRSTNTLPQNINFAVKIDYLKLLASSSGIDIPEDLKPGPDPIEHVKAYTVQVIAEK